MLITMLLITSIDSLLSWSFKQSVRTESQGWLILSLANSNIVVQGLWYDAALNQSGSNPI